MLKFYLECSELTVYMAKKKYENADHFVFSFSIFIFPIDRYQAEDESSHLDEMPLMMSEEGFENDESDYHTLPRARISQRKRGLEWFVCGGWKFLCTRFVGSFIYSM